MLAEAGKETATSTDAERGAEKVQREKRSGANRNTDTGTGRWCTSRKHEQKRRQEHDDATRPVLRRQRAGTNKVRARNRNNGNREESADEEAGDETGVAEADTATRSGTRNGTRNVVRRLVLQSEWELEHKQELGTWKRWARC